MNSQLALPREAIQRFFLNWRITQLEVFGSALRDDFGANSDVDFLVSFESESHWSLFDMVTMKSELSEIIGRQVDLVSRRGIERSKNWIRRKGILESARVYYAAR